MLALAAVILFIIALIVHGATHGYVFWMLLGLLALALHLVYDLPIPIGSGYRRRTPP